MRSQNAHLHTHVRTHKRAYANGWLHLKRGHGPRLASEAHGPREDAAYTAGSAHCTRAAAQARARRGPCGKPHQLQARPSPLPVSAASPCSLALSARVCLNVFVCLPHGSSVCLLVAWPHQLHGVCFPPHPAPHPISTRSGGVVWAPRVLHAHRVRARQWRPTAQSLAAPRAVLGPTAFKYFRFVECGL